MSEHPLSSRADTVPLIEEQLDVHREVVETGSVRVRVRSSVRTEVVEHAEVHRGLRVERTVKGAPVTERVAAWYEGDVMVVPVYEEVMVKQLILKEELRLIPTASTQDTQVAVDLVSEIPVFERRDELGQWHEVSVDEVDGLSRRSQTP